MEKRKHACNRKEKVKENKLFCVTIVNQLSIKPQKGHGFYASFM
jgi:hypothetical protein